MNDMNKLPAHCYSVLKSTGDLIVIKRGETGYYKTDIHTASKAEAESLASEYNNKLGVTVSQRLAMECGSMFGWNVPGADPACFGKKEA